MQRKDTRMLVTMGVVTAAIALVSGLAQIPPSVSASLQDPVTFSCTYEGGPSGDLSTTISKDQLALTADDWFDHGGCMWVSSAVNQRECVYTVTRGAGFGSSLGTLTLAEISDEMSISTAELKEANSGDPVDCTLREIPIDDLKAAGKDPGNVDAVFSILDDTYASGADPLIGGAVCSDEDDDGVACENLEGELWVEFCYTSPVITGLDLTSMDSLVVFTNGPRGQVDNCEWSEAPTSTTGGVLDPAGGIVGHFD